MTLTRVRVVVDALLESPREQVVTLRESFCGADDKEEGCQLRCRGLASLLNSLEANSPICA